MPTVLRSGPYRFFFYAGDRDEPPHVHIERDDIERLVRTNQMKLIEAWNEYFSR